MRGRTLGCATWAEPRAPFPTRETTTIMGRHPASKIHPWRGSGVNAPGYSRQPQQAPAAPQQAPQSPLDEYPDERVDMGKLARDRYVAMRAADAKGARLVAVAPVPAHVAGVIVYLGERAHRIPASWQIRTNTASNGMHMLFALDASDRLRVFTNASSGNLVELVDMPRDIVAEFHAAMFPVRSS